MEKIAFVTGGSRGIGKAVVKKLSQTGCKVAFCGRRKDSIEETLAEMQHISPDVLGLQADVSSSADVEQCIQTIKDTWGPVNILVNNAGIYTYSSLQETTTENWDAQFAVNLKGPFLVTRAVVPDMIQLKKGTIIFISSMIAVISIPLHSCYAATKWGLDGLAGCLGQELVEHGIKVHVIRPGFTDTTIFEGMEKPDFEIDWIQPEEIANAVDFLLHLPDHAQVPELNYTTTSHRHTY